MTTTYFSPTVKVPKIQANHTSQGTYIKINGIDAYTVGSSTTGKAVIVAHDVFGFTPRSEQLCDIIAGQGYRVIMPYFLYNDDEHPLDAVRNENTFEYTAWFIECTPIEHINGIFGKVITYLKSEGYHSFGVFGTSWGGKCAAIASQNPAFTAAVLVSAPWLNVDDFTNTQCPVAIIMPGDLRDITPVIQCLKSTKPFARKIVHKRFPDMRFGWVGTFGDYSKPLVAELATETLQIAVTFFRENLGIRSY